VRELQAALDDALESGRLRPTEADPLRVVDLGCGNAYLTFAAHAWLTRVRGLPVRLVGVDVKEQSRRHNAEVARRLGVEDEVTFVQAGIDDVRLAEPPHVVLALHACDTATDDALARAVEWAAPLVLAAPCCHKDVSRQLRDHAAPEPYALLTRDGILRERFADTLTDALRAALLRTHGYRVDVVEFVGSKHTPRNTLIRALATGGSGDRAAEEYAELTRTWQVMPRLAELLDR
jgi:SAM-dependent methyltransferase